MLRTKFDSSNFFVLRHIDYSTERYNLGTLLNIIIIGHRVNRSCVSPRSLFERIQDTRDVSMLVGASSTVGETPKGTLKFLPKFSCNRFIRIV